MASKFAQVEVCRLCVGCDQNCKQYNSYNKKKCKMWQVRNVLNIRKNEMLPVEWREKSKEAE